MNSRRSTDDGIPGKHCVRTRQNLYILVNKLNMIYMLQINSAHTHTLVAFLTLKPRNKRIIFSQKLNTRGTKNVDNNTTQNLQVS